MEEGAAGGVDGRRVELAAEEEEVVDDAGLCGGEGAALGEDAFLGKLSAWVLQA